MTQSKQQVHHAKYGLGHVLLDEGDVKTIQFLKQGLMLVLCAQICI